MRRALSFGRLTFGPRPLQHSPLLYSNLRRYCATTSLGKQKPEETIFAEIVKGKVPVDKVFEDHLSIAFHDIEPQAPTHILVIPKTPISGVDDIEEHHKEVMGHLLYTAKRVARKIGLEEGGYRLVINEGDDAQQTIEWLHIHILGGRKLGWPPG
eukprot:CAMPEP_0174252800 /NCGR_PEP_ID=MMETSP0439-20130205/2176_1 /TAXON_ID=0 /ORGANISM="Stereomyxa ramosa, Strain Chinc5" /LENGTH=154 /DNA_ID=CAMNT_0015333435 /DNA_START=15 /DNA_END=479 /DNA_ORIENTATION=-